MKSSINKNATSKLAAAPIIIEITRGQDRHGNDIIECINRGMVCVVDGENQAVFDFGDTKTPIHIRSTGKPMQVLPLLELGSFTKKKLRDSELKESDLALFMSSHAGENIHTSRVGQILESFGLKIEDLRCGTHLPLSKEAQQELLAKGETPSQIHNGCSGKHTAMLIVCKALSLDMKNYESPNHPLQKSITKFVELFSGLTSEEIDMGIDGCSLPAYCMPIKNLALIYARLAKWQESLPSELPAFLQQALQSMWHAIANYPEQLAGTNCFDSALIRASGGNIFSKTGADGVHALAIRPCKKFPNGLGVAIKICEGDHKNIIRPLIIRALLEKLGVFPRDNELDKFFPDFKNHRGIKCGRAITKI